jgi:hypothetical protein
MYFGSLMMPRRFIKLPTMVPDHEPKNNIKKACTLVQAFSFYVLYYIMCTIKNRGRYNMKTEFIKLTGRAPDEGPIYMTRRQVEDAWYIPKEYVDRIVIVDFKEKEDEIQGS